MAPRRGTTLAQWGVEPETGVCVLEAMKVMNEIKAQVSGTIARIMVANGQAVEYGQVLFKVKPF